MAEFCLECFNQLFNKKLKKRDVVLSWFKERCEGCGKIKRVVDNVKKDDCLFGFFPR